MKKVVFCVIALLMVIGGVIFLIPKNTGLSEEINFINDYLANDLVNLDEVKNEFSKSISSSKYLSSEEAFEKYALDLIDIHDNIQQAKKSEEIKDCFINTTECDKKTQNLITVFTELEKRINSIQSSDYSKELDEVNMLKYNEYVQKVDNSKDIDDVNLIITELNNMKDLNDFLVKNKKDITQEDESIVFLKRKTYMEHENYVSKLSWILVDKYDYSLIVDKKGPVINAKDATVYKDGSYKIQDNVKCIDDVDDEVQCVITGEVDLSKTGSYKVHIETSDIEGNSSKKDITIKVIEKKVNKNPYYTEVIRNQNVVVVYGLDENNEYTKVEKVFLASVGLNNKTPLGTFTTSKGYRWGTLLGGVYGQYSTRLINGILFHSVPYYQEDPSPLEWEEFNKLGTPASKGCVRMAVKDVKWIFDNCPAGMTVKIYDGDLPKGVTKPANIIIPESSPNRNWDPTDPAKNNPWHS